MTARTREKPTDFVEDERQVELLKPRSGHAEYCVETKLAEKRPVNTIECS